MTDTTKTEALRLAEILERPGYGWHSTPAECAAELRRLSADRDRLAARLDRAIRAAEEHFGDDAIRHKLSLFKNGRARNVFPQQMDGQWFAFQRADNDAHVGLALRCAEAESDRDRLAAECEALRADARRVILMCHSALGEELSAWDIDPPLHHVKEAHDACEAWIAAIGGKK